MDTIQGMSRTRAIVQGAGRINLSGGGRLAKATKLAHERNRTRMARSSSRIGNSISTAAKANSSRENS